MEGRENGLIWSGGTWIMVSWRVFASRPKENKIFQFYKKQAPT